MFRKSELGLQNSCWLKSARYDLVFLVLSPLFGFLWLVLFYIKGMEALLPAYFVQIVMTGTPHLLLTLYLLSDFQSQEKLKSSGFIFGLALSAAAISTVVIYIYKLYWISNFLISVIYLFSIWHILKQHVGISKLYDYVLSQRRNDRDISRDMRWVYLFYISAFVSCYVYVLSRPNFKHTIASPWLVELMHPPISTGFAEVCMSLSGIFFLLACYRIIYVRAWKKKLFFPIPQLLVLAGSLLQVVTFILVLPPSAWILLWLAPPLGHQIQYFGYSWLYLEKSREISQPKIRIIDLVSRRGPVVFYLIFVGLSALIYSLGLLGLALVIVLTIQLLSTAHYFIDGLIWKKNLNSDVKPVSFKLTGVPL